MPNWSDCVCMAQAPWFGCLIICILIFHFDPNQNNRKLWKWNLVFRWFLSDVRAAIVSEWAHNRALAHLCTATCVRDYLSFHYFIIAIIIVIFGSVIRRRFAQFSLPLPICFVSSFFLWRIVVVWHTACISLLLNSNSFPLMTTKNCALLSILSIIIVASFEWAAGPDPSITFYAVIGRRMSKMKDVRGFRLVARVRAEREREKERLRHQSLRNAFCSRKRNHCELILVSLVFVASSRISSKAIKVWWQVSTFSLPNVNHWNRIINKRIHPMENAIKTY